MLQKTNIESAAGVCGEYDDVYKKGRLQEGMLDACFSSSGANVVASIEIHDSNIPDSRFSLRLSFIYLYLFIFFFFDLPLNSIYLIPCTTDTSRRGVSSTRNRIKN